MHADLHRRGERNVRAPDIDAGRYSRGVPAPIDLPPLPGPYPERAYNLWRWVDSDLDAPTAAFVAALVSLTDEQRTEVRTRLAATEQHQLLTFAARRTFAAARAGDPTGLVAAFDALAGVSVDGLVDERPLWPVTGLLAHVQRQLGAPVEASVARADAKVASVIRSMVDGDSDLAFDSGLRELHTCAGLVYLKDDENRYAPDTDLVAIAYTVADLLEADQYLVEDLGVGYDIAPYYVGDDWEAAQAAKRQTGAAFVDAMLANGDYLPVSVYLAEYPAVADAELVATVADQLHRAELPQIAVARGRLCALLLADSLDGELTLVESQDSLERFRPGLIAALT
jgi:hypothetical protein